MSALVAWGVPDTAVSAPRLPQRGLPFGFDTGARRGRGVAAPGAIRLAPVEESPRLRLTARGRLLRSLVVFGALALIALARWMPSTEPDQLTVDHHTVVRPGQTLSQIAREQLPQLPIREAVVRLQLANNLSAPEISVGQTLAVPLGR